MTSNQESVSKLHGVLIYKWAVDLRISVYFHQIIFNRFKIKWYIFSMSIITCIHNNTDSQVDVTSVNFNSQKIYEDNIFERQNVC